MLSLSEVDSFYGRSHILHGVSLEAPRGQITTVLGRNGVGKTTLLKTIMGLTDKADGAIRLDEREIGALPTFERARAGIAYVPQGREIIPDFSVAENIMMGGFGRGARANGTRGVPEIVGRLFPYLTENLGRPGGLLSGGQQQQLAIARALAAEPSVLLLDEPTEGIQPNIVEQIEETIQVLNRELGLTIVLIEQNVEFARSASHRYAILENGRIVSAGEVGQLSDEVVNRHMAL